MTLADRIRRHVIAHHVVPARLAGRDTVTVRAGDVARTMALKNRTSAVCGALESSLFQEQARVRLLERRGPRRSTTTEFVYAPLGGMERIAAPPHSADGAFRSGGPAHDKSAGRRLYLVSCVKPKRAEPAPARDLYTSHWFRKASACVETTGSPWRILSAHYGLVDPDQEIHPYEKTLTTMPVAERRAWAREVLLELEQHLAGADTVVFFAGERYREFLVPALRERGVAVRVPMAGLGLGEQMAWLGACLHD